MRKGRLFRLFACLTTAAALFGQDGETATASPRVPSRVVVEAVSWNSGVVYAYDGAGNIRTIGTDVHVYDAVSRLVQSDAAGQRQQYTYDGFGNRLTCAGTAGSDCQYGYAVDRGGNRNRMAAVTYSAAGNVTGYGGMTIVYDAVKMPVRKSVGTIAEEYVYTADDERIAVYDTVNNWRWTLRDTSGKVLRELTSQNAGGVPGAGSWSWTKDYVYRDGQLLATRQTEPGGGVTTYHYHLDHLGTPRRITNHLDAIVGVHDYHAFGPETSGGTNEPSLMRLKFTGHERDQHVAFSGALELDYMHARYYAGAWGRFLAVDPGRDWDLRQPQSWNVYSYVRNNPINRVDPTGRCGEDANFVGPRIPCAAQSEAKPKPQRNNSPAQGQEPGTQEIPDGKGGKTVRTYGPDGRAVTDVDYGHGHDGAPDPHVHDWDWDKKKPRQDWRAPNPGEIPDPAKSTSIGQRRPDLQTIIGATILSIGGTAILIMTGGAMSLQPNAAGVVIVPRTGIAPLPTNQSDCPPTSPYCT